MSRTSYRQTAIVRKMILLFTVSIIFLLTLFPTLLNQADWLIGDHLTKMALTDRIPEHIIILDIDDPSLQTIGPWPWSRETLAITLSLLFEHHRPKGVALDLVFPEARNPQGDRQLAQVLQKYPICLAVAFDLNARNQSREIGYLTNGIELQQNSVQANGFVASHRELSQAAHCVGHITPTVDKDGVIRTIPQSIQWQNRVWLSLSQSLWTEAIADNQSGHVYAKSLKIPYRIQPQNWKTVSVLDLLFQNVPPGFFDNSYILVGSSAMGLSDRVTTPIDPWLPGVVIHAEILDSLMHPSTLDERIARPIAVAYAILVVWVLFYAFIRFQPGVVILFSVLLLIVWLGVAFYLIKHQADFPPALPLIAMLLMLGVQTPYEWLVVHKQNRRMAKLFRGYLSENVANRILDSDEDILEPQLRTITVLFADIEGFTKMAERMETTELAKLTVEVLTILTEAVHSTDGTLDKYIGDAVMAFWNAPLAQPDHAQLAVKSALSMLKRLEEFNLKNPQWPDITIRIGINTGLTMVGELGTQKRHTYTAIGEVVNDAHRLHEKSKAHHTYLLISQETKEQLSYKVLPDEIKVAQSKTISAEMEKASINNQ